MIRRFVFDRQLERVTDLGYGDNIERIVIWCKWTVYYFYVSETQIGGNGTGGCCDFNEFYRNG